MKRYIFISAWICEEGGKMHGQKKKKILKLGQPALSAQTDLFQTCSLCGAFSTFQRTFTMSGSSRWLDNIHCMDIQLLIDLLRVMHIRYETNAFMPEYGLCESIFA